MSLSIINSYASDLQEALKIDETKKGIDNLLGSPLQSPRKEDVKVVENSRSFFDFFKRQPSVASLNKTGDIKPIEQNSGFFGSFIKALGPNSEQKKIEIITTFNSPRNKTPREIIKKNRFSIESLQEHTKKSYDLDKVVEITISFTSKTFGNHTKSTEEIEVLLVEEVKKDIASNFSMFTKKSDLCILFSQHKTLPKNLKKTSPLTYMFYNILRKEFKQRFAVDELSGNLTTILNVVQAKHHLTEYLKSCHCAGQLYFLNAIDSFTKLKSIDDQNKEFLIIYNEYIELESENALNMGPIERVPLAQARQTLENNTKDLSTIFEDLYMKIKCNLKSRVKDGMNEYKKSVHFINLCKEFKI